MREELRVPAVDPPTTTWENGNREAYWRIVWRVANDTIEAYVYDDGAGIMKNGDDWTAFEAPDYQSPDDLLSAFIDKLRQTLGGRGV